MHVLRARQGDDCAPRAIAQPSPQLPLHGSTSTATCTLACMQRPVSDWHPSIHGSSRLLHSPGLPQDQRVLDPAVHDRHHLGAQLMTAHVHAKVSPPQVHRLQASSAPAHAATRRVPGCNRCITGCITAPELCFHTTMGSSACRRDPNTIVTSIASSVSGSVLEAAMGPSMRVWIGACRRLLSGRQLHSPLAMLAAAAGSPW